VSNDGPRKGKQDPGSLYKQKKVGIFCGYMEEGEDSRILHLNQINCLSFSAGTSAAPSLERLPGRAPEFSGQPQRCFVLDHWRKPKCSPLLKAGHPDGFYALISRKGRRSPWL